MTIEVQSWSPDGTTMLAILDGASSVQWTDLLGDVGSGSCQLSVYDPKYAYCTKGNLVKFLLNGTPAFAFFNTAPKLTIGEAEASVLTLAGNAVLDYLGRAGAYPPGGYAAPTGTAWTWTGQTFGGILKILIDAAQVRGTIPALTYDFSATLDSAGAAWTANVSLTVDAKATILDVAKKLVALGMGIYMDPQLKLHAYIPGAQGANLASTVIWQYGRHFTSPVDRAGVPTNGPVGDNTGSMPTTVVLVEGTGGVFVEASDPAYTANPAYGRIETAVDYSTVTADATQMTAAGNAQIALSEAAAQAITVNLNHGTDAGSFEPYRDYRPGDTVAINVPGQYANAPGQVVGLTIAQTPNADYTVSANLGSIALPIELRLARMLAASTGTTSNVSGGVAGSLTLSNPTQTLATLGGQPLDSDLTAIAALTTTAYGRALLTLANANGLLALTSGAAFPTGAALTAYGDNVPFFRTDLGEWYYHDGTGWHALLAGTGRALAPASVAATGKISCTNAVGGVRITHNTLTASATFVDVTDAAITVTTGASTVWLTLEVQLTAAASGRYYCLTFNVDGTDVESGHDIFTWMSAIASHQGTVVVHYLTPVLSAGSHTFKGRIRNNYGGGASDGASASATSPGFLWVQEQMS